MPQTQVALTQASEIMRAMHYGWVHTIHEGRSHWVTKATRTRDGSLFLTLHAKEADQPGLIVRYDSATVPVWTLV